MITSDVFSYSMFCFIFFQNSAFEEVDKGQPCLSCGDKCLGFVPHKWR